MQVGVINRDYRAYQNSPYIPFLKGTNRPPFILHVVPVRLGRTRMCVSKGVKVRGQRTVGHFTKTQKFKKFLIRLNAHFSAADNKFVTMLGKKFQIGGFCLLPNSRSRHFKMSVQCLQLFCTRTCRKVLICLVRHIRIMVRYMHQVHLYSLTLWKL